MATSGRVERDSEIQVFYRGTSVLVTGATGFIGKVLLEKLLRSCRDISAIYLLVRNKKEKHVQERIEELVKSPCFDRLRQEVPDFRSKLLAVEGDIQQAGLGISDDDRHLLVDQVNIVFHVAASVNFSRPVNDVMQANVLSTRDLLVLCKTLKNLQAMVHVSTAFSNCPRMHIEERFYEPPIPLEEALRIADSVQEYSWDDLQNNLSERWPNVYTLSKAVAEDVVRVYGEGMPVAVFRPSIVLCTSKEPTPGWVDSCNGPVGTFTAIIAGKVRTFELDREKNANCVPCDMAVNALIAVAWKIAERNNSTGEIPVYNFVSTRRNGMNWTDFFRQYIKIMRDIPYSKAVWYPFLTPSSTHMEKIIFRLIYHYIPAVVLDNYAIATGRKPEMLEFYRKFHRNVDMLSYFYQYEWTFEESGMSGLWDEMSPEDRRLFPCDMDSLDWHRFYQDTAMGLRMYSLEDAPETLPGARARMNKLEIAHKRLLAFMPPDYLVNYCANIVASRKCKL